MHVSEVILEHLAPAKLEADGAPWVGLDEMSRAAKLAHRIMKNNTLLLF